MLNYPFPYEKPGITEGFNRLRDLLLAAVMEKNEAEFAKLAKRYTAERKKFLAQLAPDDHKYFSFQLWQEGIARYTQIMAAEAAALYQPSEEYKALADFESFAAYAARARQETLDDLKRADLAKRIWQSGSAWLFIHSVRRRVCCSTGSMPDGKRNIFSACFPRIRISSLDHG